MQHLVEASAFQKPTQRFPTLEEFAEFGAAHQGDSWSVRFPMEGELQADIIGGEWQNDDDPAFRDGSICVGPDQFVELSNGRRTVTFPRSEEGLIVSTNYYSLNITYRDPTINQPNRQVFDRSLVWVAVPRYRVGLRNPFMRFGINRNHHADAETLSAQMLTARDKATNYLLGALLDDPFTQD